MPYIKIYKRPKVLKQTTNSNLPKILLIFPAPKQRNLYINSLPPLGILSIAAVLEKNGIKSEVIDMSIDNINKFDVADFDIIGFSIHCANIIQAFELIKKIKHRFPEKTIIVGGPHVNSQPEYFIKNKFIDVVVKGEGEETMLEYVKRKDKEKVKGLFLKKGGKIIFTGERERIKNLDDLPFPALHKVDIKKYDVPIRKKKPISSIMTSRGCPYQCIFCFHSLGYLWTSRSPENIVDEIEWQVNKFGVKEICIFDDNFTLNVERAEKVCDIILKRGVKVKLQFTNGIRVDRVNRELLVKLKKAGLWLVGVAPESGNQESLMKIKKKFDLKKVEEVVEWCKEIGLNTHSYFMVGFPWEKKQHIKNTIDYALKLDTNITQFSRVVPLPNTELFRMMKLDVNESFSKERGLFYGTTEHKISGISEKEIGKMIKQGYKKFYLKPRKILDLMIMLSPINLFKLFKYSIETESII